MAQKFKQHYFKSFDGTEIGYQTAGSGETPFVLCNGLGGSMIAWSPLYDALWSEYSFVTWDYRGLFSSSVPKDLNSLTIPDHVLDLEALLKHLKIKKALFGGWSMGVQVALEYYRQHAKQFKALFLINGTYGYPFHTALNSPLSKYLIPKVNDLLKKHVGKIQNSIQPIAEYVIDLDGFVETAAKMGLVHKNLDSTIFKEVAQSMMATNLTVYHHILEHLSEHDASDVLPQIKCPTLIMASTNDKMTPHSTAEKMAEIIPHAQLFQINKGSHYSLLEFPELITRRLAAFLAEVK